MDVRLAPEQVALRQTARKLVAGHGPHSVADLDDGDRAARLDAAVAAAGWRELRDVGEGNLPLASGVEVAIVAEELGRGAADVAFIGPVLAADLARRAGRPELAGTTIALSPDLRRLGHATGTDAEGDLVAVDATSSTAALVLRDGAGGIGLEQCPLRPPVARTDLTRAVAGVDLSRASVLEGTQALSPDDLAAWSALALAALSADLVGVMRGAVELARDYATVREQYGSPIGAFQSVQHLIADAHVATEGAYSLTLHAAWAADALEPSAALLAAREAKAYASRAARSVCETAIQVHGGIGNTWECMAHVYLRRALHSSDILGGADASLAYVLAQHGLEVGAHGLR
ncbi:acyl-CoA dehydrogenase family protein [Aeromicrobium choanae]|uniref:Acyl-CoA dehydrogenase n=1 Tax=Aeromicrobium choanae TaxID=1736691 RepID=A0A1T4YXX7_9ACTN|nr:acyl-CoA dehydrogenase family protein [Aeromicrobium choanae]SKB06151.1 Acyl-CoA dehydrogenase [Aeromicrobium choanae]